MEDRVFFKTSTDPIEIPENSLPVKREVFVVGRGTIDHNAGV